jgi:Rrf2 family protein
MLTQTVEYALRTVVYLASRPGTTCTALEIARATKVPQAYLSKVIQSLSRAGIVHSQRGVGGGASITRPADDITILEVVSAVDPIRRIKECPLGLAAHGARLCPLHHRLDSALAMVQRAFAETTLAEVLAEPSKSVPLCPFPQRRARKLA